MAKKKTTKRKTPKKTAARARPRTKAATRTSVRITRGPSRALAIVALILNIIILPGLGSLIAGRTKTGIWQLVLTVIGALLSTVIIGIPIVIAAWVWGIVTGINLIQSAH